MVSEAESFDQFRSWHDEAYLYVNQGMTQESPNIGRYDMALMMYQRGMGLIDQVRESVKSNTFWIQPKHCLVGFELKLVFFSIVNFPKEG